jgi:membrane-bound ClpP family serine protease
VSWHETTGRAHVNGEVWEARSKQRLAKGQKIRVISRAGLTLDVEGIP